MLSSRSCFHFFADKGENLHHASAYDLLKLSLDEILESLGISSELGDTLSQLLDGHLIFVEGETELSLVVDVGLLGDVESGSFGGVELLGDGF